jgi:hypothetical protein
MKMLTVFASRFPSDLVSAFLYTLFSSRLLARIISFQRRCPTALTFIDRRSVLVYILSSTSLQARKTFAGVARMVSGGLDSEVERDVGDSGSLGTLLEEEVEDERRRDDGIGQERLVSDRRMIRKG